MDIAERIQAVLNAEADAIRSVSIDANFEKAVRLTAGCEGKILTT